MKGTVETLVMGASAAGLATAAELHKRGRECEILEAEDVVAASWRRHYDRLHLHTPKGFSALPGLPMPKSWPRYPARDQVVEYLELYQKRFALRPHFDETVHRVDRVDGAWETTTSKGIWRSANVVIATGRARVPVRPTWPDMDSYRGDLLHSSEYRNGDPWKGRPVLVVGFGNSACEQALDLLERGAEVHLAVRSAVNVLPCDIFGVVPVLPLGIVMRRLPTRVADALAWPMVRTTVGDVTKVGLRKLPYGPNTQIARDHHIPLLDIGTMDQIKQGRIAVHGDVDRFTEDGVVFSNGSQVAFDAVVLATGYRASIGDLLVGWEAVCSSVGKPSATVRARRRYPVHPRRSGGFTSAGCTSRRRGCFVRSVSRPRELRRTSTPRAAACSLRPYRCAAIGGETRRAVPRFVTPGYPDPAQQTPPRLNADFEDHAEHEYAALVSCSCTS